MMREAYDDYQSSTREKNDEIFKNLISHGYVKIKKLYQKVDKDYGDTFFNVTQDLVIWLMFADGQYSQMEYDAYYQFCEYAGFKPLSVTECSKRKKELGIDYIMSLVQHIVMTRHRIPDDDYESYVKSLCFLAVLGYKDLVKDEYTLISYFFNEETDYCPSWEQFNQEFKN